ncbi:hypothetical protein DIZ81_13620 [Legionella taurinensis]|uniref:Leucine-rich repeat domain-containing protein n=1 Tax=Legionella taurinensis TaxID=70611 RepID=A0A3A5L0L9_9GAMM|nr:hypothetical protein [Legionella taurinensis]MDX1838797.1 hypothetical protein [Legionella taurinensis]PUT38657.1 hypothetical protein DB744_13630 [Legionella taurinensis]PUT39855.1 hypothetical protein DB746_13030 [Legionella taurinensis]PUT41847.1 hypothetical protein DB743_13515 [Legionella taurinensis]PUT45342.1 hypothetical protein DB745_12970 [Legionella taurinensis]
MKIELKANIPLDEQIKQFFMNPTQGEKKEEDGSDKTLDLAGSKLGKRKISELIAMVEAIKQYAPGIETVDLSHNGLSFLKADLALLIAAFKDSSIKKLILCVNNLGANKPDDLLAIANSLAKSGLLMFDLANNSLQKLDLYTLEQFLKQLNTPKLESVRLDDSSLSGLTGADKVAQILFETLGQKVKFEADEQKELSFMGRVKQRYEALVKGEYPNHNPYSFYQNQSKKGENSSPVGQSNRFV